MSPHRLAEVLKGARLASGMSQRALAKKVGTVVSVISVWESGGHAPTLPNLDRWARSLGYTVELNLAGQTSTVAAIRVEIANEIRTDLILSSCGGPCFRDRCDCRAGDVVERAARIAEGKTPTKEGT